MIITRPREWKRILKGLESLGARTVFLVGCGQCASVAGTGGEEELQAMADKLRREGFEVNGWTTSEVACHSGGTRLQYRKRAEEVDRSDAVLVLTCGAGVQTVSDAVEPPVLPGLESAFLGNVVRHGVFEERCQMCGECVLDQTAGICPVTTCPKGLLNGPCGGMWEGMCEVLTDRRCTHVRIQERLEAQGRQALPLLQPKDHSMKRKPGSIDLRSARKRGRRDRSGREGHADDGATGGEVPR